MSRAARRLGLVAVALVAASAIGAAAGPWRASRHGAPERAVAVTADRTTSDARRFLEAYLAADGRVVRHDQGGDTVSEGQAYALLVSVGVGDRATFDRVWAWTTVNLQRPDGLLAWRWADGAVVDPEPAADADLDAAWALALAARRWPRGGYEDAARTIADGVAAHETAQLSDGTSVLAAGPWAIRSAADGRPVVVNPSYASPVAESVLAADGLADPTLGAARRAGARRVVAALLEDRGVPTDWARVSQDGTTDPADSPTEAGGGRFGWDAVRVPLRFAPSCDPADRSLAAQLWPAFQAGAGVEAMRDHPARLVGAAAAAAADAPERAQALLDEASESDTARSTYYGSALTALGRLLLGTDRLGGCPPLARR